MEQKTLLMSRYDIEKVLTMQDAIEAVENVFRLYGEHKVQMPPKMYLNFDKGDLRCMPAYARDLEVAIVKSVNVHPDNIEMPAVMGTMPLMDPENGFQFAIMDSTYITMMRTGAAGGIAAKYLSRKDSRTAGFVGAGAQARTQLEALMIARPSISEVIVYDTDKKKKREFVRFAIECAMKYGKKDLEALCAGSVEEVSRASDILTTVTPVKKPIVGYCFVQKGTHINAIGADKKGKQELDPEIIRHAKIVIDDLEQASHSGEINVPLSKGDITPDDIYANMGEIVTGMKPGRENDDEITVFDSTGLAIQDLACAAHVYNAFRNNPELLKKLASFKFF